jgi:hypothetical protein
MEIGWIAAIIVGGIAGWLAEQFMKSEIGFLMNMWLIERSRLYDAINTADGDKKRGLLRIE